MKTQIKFKKSTPRYLVNHYRMWDYLVKHPLMRKGYYFDSKKIKMIPYSECYLCGEHWPICQNCELGKLSPCTDRNGLYESWCASYDSETKTEYAIEIRDLGGLFEKYIIKD